MKRNQRTVAVARKELAPLTERVLAQMGQEGAVIRQRLLLFYQARAGPDLSQPERPGKQLDSQ